MNQYPATLLESPEAWGNVTIYADSDRMAQIVAELKTHDDDWATISVMECRELVFVRPVGKRALYTVRRALWGEDVLIEPGDTEGYYRGAGWQIKGHDPEEQA